MYQTRLGFSLCGADVPLSARDIPAAAEGLGQDFGKWVLTPPVSPLPTQRAPAEPERCPGMCQPQSQHQAGCPGNVGSPSEGGGAMGNEWGGTATPDRGVPHPTAPCPCGMGAPGPAGTAPS